MPCPTRQEYFTTIQNPQLAFQDPDLKAGQPRLTPMGLPWGCNGAFATVYRIQTANRDWAVKCFLNDFADQHQRYKAISEHLNRLNLPYTIGFDFQPRGILVSGRYYPLLKMEWIQGDRLDEYIKTNLGNAGVLSLLASNWLRMMATLRQASIAHGDLQHGNILVVNGDFRLIDYDGMFVPSLAGHSSHEVGHSNYQHPSRTASDFGPYLDNFSSWVIYLSFLALRLDPQLWHRIQSAGDDRMLFSKDDFENPEFSDALRVIGRANDSQIQSLVAAIRAYARLSDISQVPPLAVFSVRPPVEETTIQPPSADWIKDHVRNRGSTPPATVKKDPQMDGGSWIETHLEPLTPLTLNGSLALERLGSLSLLVAILTGLLSLATETLNALYGIPTAGAIGGFLWLLLRHRFGRLPEVQARNQLLKQVQTVEFDIAQFASAVSKRNHQMAALNANEDSRCNALKQKHRTLDNFERSELASLQSQFVAQQDQSAVEKKQLDSQEFQVEGEIRMKVRQSEEAERREKESNQRALQQKLNDIKTTRLQSQQSEDGAIRQALARVQNAFVQNELEWWTLAGASIEQIGTRMKQRLRINGINTAADIPDYWGSIRVDGIGYFRAQRLVDWKKDLETRIRDRAPRCLPVAEEEAIRSPARSQRQTLDINEQLAKQNAERKDREIATARKNERLSLESNLRDLKTQLQNARRQLEAREKNTQTVFQQKKDTVAVKWREEKLAVERESKRIQEEFQSQRNKIENQVRDSNKQLSKLHWDQNRVKRDLTAYRNINFAAYLKAIVLPRR